MRGVNRRRFGIHGRVEAEKQKQDAVTAQRNLEAKNRDSVPPEEASWASFTGPNGSFTSVKEMKGSPYWRER